jgi:hypothetical protein
MDKIWYYMKTDRSKHGPFSEEELIEMIGNKTIDPKEYIWMPDLTRWLRLENSIYSFYIPAEETASKE